MVGSGAPPVRRLSRQLTAALRPAQPAAPADANCPASHDARTAVAVVAVCRRWVPLGHPPRLRVPLLSAGVLAGCLRLRPVAVGRLHRGLRNDQLRVRGSAHLLLLWVRRVGRYLYDDITMG